MIRWSVLFLLVAQISFGQKITRMPYLQCYWGDSLVIVFRANGLLQNVEFQLNNKTQKYPVVAKRLDDTTVEYKTTLTKFKLTAPAYYSFTYGTKPKKLLTDTAFTIRPKQAGAFNFITFGDIGRDPAEVGYPQVTANRIANTPPTSEFILALGDIIYKDGENKDYDPFLFKHFNNIFPNTPFYPILGNHDWHVNPDSNYTTQWVLPGNEHYYSFDYNNVHFICLDSKAGDFYNYDEQKRWLEADLQKAQGKYDWIFVALHHPGHHCNYKKQEPLVIALYPLFAKYGVNVVLNGHAHTYERLHPYDANGNVIEAYKNNTKEYSGIANGFISITTGAGGVLDPTFVPGNCDSLVAAYRHVGHYMQFFVDGKTLRAKAINSFTGEVFDSFTIKK